MSDQCEHADHEWAPAGGGLLICMRCETEKWADPIAPHSADDFFETLGYGVPRDGGDDGE